MKFMKFYIIFQKILKKKQFDKTNNKNYYFYLFIVLKIRQLLLFLVIKAAKALNKS